MNDAPTASDAQSARESQQLPEARGDDWYPAPLRALAALSRFMAWLEGVGICICLAVVVLLSVWQFIERNLATHHIPFLHVPIWVDGVVRHSVFILGFLGAAYASCTYRHIRIDAVTRMLSPRGRLILRVFTGLVAVFIVGLFVYGSFGFYQVTLSENADASQIGQFFTPARGTKIMVIGYAVTALHFFIHVIIDLAWLVSKREPPDWLVAEVHT